MMKRVPCIQESERTLLIVSIIPSLMCPLCQAINTLTPIMIPKNNNKPSISCLVFIIIVSRIHYQNPEGQESKLPVGRRRQKFWYSVRPNGVRSTRGSVRLPIGAFWLDIVCLVSLCLAWTVCLVCKRFRFRNIVCIDSWLKQVWWWLLNSTSLCSPVVSYDEQYGEHEPQYHDA